MRQIFLLDLKSADLAPAYEDWHRPGRVPQGVLDDIRASGVAAMQIYRCGDRLVLISETADDAPASNRVASQASREWEALMDSFQQPLPQAQPGQKWAEARGIFDLDHHPTQG